MRSSVNLTYEIVIPTYKLGNQSRRKPYINREAQDKIRKKSRLGTKYLNCKTTTNFDNYKKARNETTKALRLSKYSCEQDIASKIKTNPKLFCKYVRSKTKTAPTMFSVKSTEGIITQDPLEVATIMNNYFASVFTKDDPSKPLPQLPSRTYQSPLENVPITEQIVEQAVLKINSNKSPGPDNIHPNLIVKTIKELKRPLTLIYRKSLQEGTLPNQWKKANVSPIYKKGSRKDPGNYRPISLTSVPSKILQRIIRDAIIKHMVTKQIFTKEQHGFRHGRSCTTQLLETLEDWITALDNGYNIFKLTFTEHVNNATAKANKIMGVIFRTFTYMDPDVFTILFKTLVGYIEYGSTIWSLMYQKDKRAIENVQRRATKRIPSLKDIPYGERLRKLGLPTLEYRRKRSDLIQTYKIINKIDSIDTRRMFQKPTYTATRGNANKIFKKSFRLNSSRNFFSNRVVNLWNGLPTDVSSAPNVNIFKSRLNNHWKHHPSKFASD